MEKLIFVLWNDGNEDRSHLNRRLLGEAADQLGSDGVIQRVQINARDDRVAAGSALEQGENLPAATVSLWLPSAHEAWRVDNILRPIALGGLAAFSVVESTVLPHGSPPAPDGRCEGFSQLAFFRRRAGLGPEEFREIWLNDHREVAIATQETFHYTQNIVYRPITPNAPHWDGIVDEWYPDAALIDPLIYWKAGGSVDRQEFNFQRETQSVLRFVDLSGMALIITSAYRIGGWSDAAT